MNNVSTVASVQNIIDCAKNAITENQPNGTGTTNQLRSVTSSTIDTSRMQGDTSTDKIIDIDQFDNTGDGLLFSRHSAGNSNLLQSDSVQNHSNIVIEMPDIANRIDKIELAISSIYTIMSQMDEKINKILEAVANVGTLISADTTSQPTTNLSVTIPKFASLLPIKNEQEFYEFETMLRNKTYYEQFIAEMATYGGRSGDKKGYKIAYGLIDQLFTREFMTKCSWTGSSKGQAAKISFSSAISFLNAFFDIVHLADSRYTKTDAKEFIKDKILRNANSRLVNLQRKEFEEPVKKRRRTIKENIEATVAETSVTDTSPTATTDHELEVHYVTVPADTVISTLNINTTN